MKVAFITELPLEGKVPYNYLNMRTEFAWMQALNADHFNINRFTELKNYDHVFIIFPKGRVFLSAEGSKIINGSNPVSKLLEYDLIQHLKNNNKKIYYIQEGPHWWFNEYELADQIKFYNLLAECDAIFAHNQSDTLYYKGLFPGKNIYVIPSLMIESSIPKINFETEEKAIIGGNFSRWYGGFQSYIVAENLDVPIWVQTSHATRDGENGLVNQLPRLMWSDWISELSRFKYAVHLMPTVAAGTFSLNCAYLGIPCIGNREVDTQKLCHPNLSVDVHDIEYAVKLAKKLKEDKSFYEECSYQAKNNYKLFYSIDSWKEKMNNILCQ
jgi:hypothetical protein